MSGQSDPKTDAFRVTWGQSLLERAAHGSPGFSRWLGNLESKVLRTQLDSLRIDRPIYVAGLARSGSTILLEALATHPTVASHQYRDFPLIFTPYWSQRIQRHRSTQSETPTERAHGDGLAVTLDSPEAMEEPIWMSFFPDAHTPGAVHVLDDTTEHAAFESFYRDHLRKILMIRKRSRYVSKGNYNFTRLRYLLKLFPDARMIVPIRNPREHIASLMKQQRLFARGETAHPRALEHMRRVGHFEFGLDRRPIDVGNPDVLRQVESLWKNGDEVRGWARYWAYLYGWIFEQRLDYPELSRSAQIVRFEDLCAEPQAVLSRIAGHCGLSNAGPFAQFADRIQPPTYYRPEFSESEEAVILEETATVAAWYGYGEPSEASTKLSAGSVLNAANIANQTAQSSTAT